MIPSKTASLLFGGLFLLSSIDPSRGFVVNHPHAHGYVSLDSTGAGWVSTSSRLRMAEATEITMPALSSTMKEGRIVSWLKSEGDKIDAGEAIMVVESDKADMDVEAFEEGFLAKILTQEGETADVGATVALVAATEAEIDAVAAGAASTSAGEPAAVEAPAPAGAGGYSVPVTEIFMPALSSTMSEGKIVSWLKSPGDKVSAGEAIMVVESDKADMDVEAFEDGYLAAILTEEGETADVGAPVGILVEEESQVAAVQDGPAPVAAAAPATGAAPASTAAPAFEFSQIDMPALSSTMKEGKVVSWLKAEGDKIESGEAIMVVESDKADMDVESFEDGYLAAILTEEGESADVGKPVAFIAAEEANVPALKAYAESVAAGGGAVAAAPVPAAVAVPPKATAAAPVAAAPKPTGGRVVASPLAKKLAEQLGVDLATVAGTGPNGRITGADVETASKTGGSSKPATADAPAKPTHVPAAGVIAATPMARAAAKKAKVDLASIVGTGQFGRVTVDDVLIATGQKEAPKPKKKSSAAPEIELPSGKVPFTGMQRAVSNNMEATLTTPVFRCSREIRMDDFDALYQKVKPKGVTVSALLAKAVAMAIVKHPIINSSYDPSGATIFNEDVNIAMAVAIDGGLITPTLKYANERDIYELGENWKELVGKAKSGTLSPDEYNSGTFTISNLGMFGVSQFDAILPPGQGSILAIGGTQEKVVVDKAAVLGLKTVKAMTVTITCDHRQIYGADAALFLKTLADIMENQTDMLAK